MEINYKIDYQEEVVLYHIPSLSQADRALVKQAIEKKLTLDPVSFGKPLRYSMKGHRRLRVGNYRVVYRIVTETQRVIIVAIKHRAEVYG